MHGGVGGSTEGKSYYLLAVAVIERAIIDGDRYFFKNEKTNSIWLDLINSYRDFNLSGQFFLSVLDNNYMGKSGAELLLYLSTLGFRSFPMYVELWRKWYNKPLSSEKLLEELKGKYTEA